MSQTPSSASAAPAVGGKPVPVARVILLIILAVLLILLGYDYLARYRMRSVVNQLQQFLPASDPRPDEPAPPTFSYDEVRGRLGVEPVDASESPGLRTELYRWDGVFNVYEVRATYRGIAPNRWLADFTAGSRSRFAAE